MWEERLKIHEGTNEVERDKEFDAIDTFHETGSGDAKPKWGGGNICPKCQKTVYFAEQLKVKQSENTKRA